MGLAIDTTLYDVHNAATSAIGLTAATVTASGDTAQIRSFDPPSKAYLYGVSMQGSGTRRIQLTSPRLHDNVKGLAWQTPESPSEFLFPSQGDQSVYSVDTIGVQLDAAASSDTVACLHTYYTDIQGIAADLRSWDQVRANLINYKILEVDCTSSGTIGAWADTAVNTTDKQLKADFKYAVLGIETSAALVAMGVKGPATGNLRICAPGAAVSFPLTEYFIRLSEHHNRPFIPVFKANDQGATFVSIAANTASVSADVFLVLAQLPA